MITAAYWPTVKLRPLLITALFLVLFAGIQSASAFAVVCGDGNMEGAEECDDNNTADSDGCSSICRIEDETCGDGNVDTGEDCDDGQNSATCNADCTFSACGDDYLNTTDEEACDDGNTTNNDGCSSTCVVEVCGDEITQTNEDCDAGAVDTESCNADCTEAVCGDEYVNTTAEEACDDGNTENEDGCNEFCAIEGCTDEVARNYNPEATVDDDSCEYWITGCTNPDAENYDPGAEADDGSCVCDLPEPSGCTDPEATNYDEEAIADDGSCEFESECVDPEYDPADEDEDIMEDPEEGSCEGGLTGIIADVIKTVWNASERWRNLQKACLQTWETYGTAMPGTTKKGFLSRCDDYAIDCNKYAKENATDVTDGPWGDPNQDAMRHRCMIAGLSCEFGQEVAEAWGEFFEVHGGDCNFQQNYTKCAAITLTDHTTWQTGNATEEAALADSCRDIANNNYAKTCMDKMCNSYYANGHDLPGEIWLPIFSKPKLCCEPTILGKPPPRNQSGTCSKEYCEKMAHDIADQEINVYELYEKDPGPPPEYVVAITPGSAGTSCPGY